MLIALGASPPEVVKVRVPSALVPRWFPAGSDLRVLPFDRFESLAKAARDRPSAPRAPRLLKARHSARWDAGRLLGRTELTVEASPDPAAGPLILEPWSPALVDRGAGSRRLRATPDGRLGLVVGPAEAEPIAFEWTLRARPGSDGRSFALALPGVDLSTLTIDAPGGLVPEATAGPRVGPEPGPSSGRSAWRFEAARGSVDLRFRDLAEAGDAARPDAPRLWLEGTTKVDLGAGPINWRADWTLDESPGSPRSLTIAFDPGLEVVDVSGPRVASTRLEPDGPRSKVSIKLDGEGDGPSTLTIRATCRVPAEGSWAVPSARPIDATWTGGRTLVRLDAGRVLQSSLERSGRRVPPRPGEVAGPADLVFEPWNGTGPVADLTFHKPSSDATVEVRGHLRLGDDVPRIEVALTWSVEKGHLPSIAADLPPGWTTDRVVSLFRHPVPWHADPLGNGGTRVHLGPPAMDEMSKTLTLTLAASARRAGVAGPLDLPRVRPASGARFVDEVWVATPDPGLAIKPISARGLAWIDPPDPPIDDVPTPWVADDLPGALAWRWLAEDAGAAIDRTPPGVDPRGEATLEATIRPGRLALDWSIEVESAGAGLGAIPIHLDDEAVAPIAWRSGEAGGPILEPRPMDEARRALLGFPGTGLAWDLPLSTPSKGRARVFGRADRPWPGRGRLPLLTFPERYRGRGTVAVVVEDATRVKVEPTGLSPVEPPARLEDAAAEEVPSTGARLRKAAVLGYGPAGGKLAVETTDPSTGSGGLIREAYLVSHASPGSGMRHRLTLGVAAESARPLALRMPRGVAIDRLRRDGLAVAATPTGEDVLVEIPAPGPDRPLRWLTIDYRTDDDPRAGPIEPHRLLPRCSLPCLGFAWELVVPDPWELGRVDPGLEATDPRSVPSAASRLLGFHWSPWGDRDPGPSAKAKVEAGEAMLRDLDNGAGALADGEANLGDWLLKLDAGRWPLVVDRLALRSAGWGPASRIGTAAAGSARPGPVLSTLEPMGLAAVPLEGLILITGRDEVPGDLEGRRAWSAALRAVPSEDGDATDRFQSAARWREEATPQAPAAGEPARRPDGDRRSRAWRVVAAGWPTPGASVSLVDGRRDRAWGWFVASAVLAAGLLLRDRPARARAVGLAGIGVLATVGLAWQWPEPSTGWAGLLRGALGVMAFWLGRSFRPSPPPSTVAPGAISTTGRRVGSVAGLPMAPIVAVATMMGLGVASLGAPLDSEADGPILALLPFDGPADPATRPDRAILLVKDAERLERLARGDDRPAVVASTSLKSATHRVGRDEPGMAVVEGAFEVEVDGPGPASWTFPVGPAIELSAVVDARPSPLAISPDGLSATLTFEGAGVHELRFRRLVPLAACERGGRRARVPINRAAFARVAVAKGVGPSWVEVAGASGELSVQGGGIEGGLGPVDSLDVRWYPEDRPTTPGFAGPVDATFLWDARPAGDLIRMRLVHDDPEGASVVRIALEPGLVVRRCEVPNLVSIRPGGTAARPSWVAHVDPPLPRGTPIEVDFWRDARPGARERRWPDIEVVTAGRCSGLVGFRRPGDWSGRLEPPVGVEPASEASFAKAWGNLPADGLTLAGVVKYGRPMALEVATAPLPPRRSIRTKVVLEPAPGRLNALIEGTLTDRQGRSFELEVAIPVDLRVVRVEADGLLDWRRAARDGLRLQFDGSEASERKIRIEASLPAPADSAMTESRNYQAKVPWPRWSDAEPAPGTLEIVGPSRVPFDPGEGITAMPAAASAEAEPPIRSTYRVERDPGPSTVRWSSPPARVNVLVESELAIDPAQMTWTAALDCEVSGGPAECLNLSLPTEWAEAASLEIEGMTHRRESRPEGTNGKSTQWKVFPASPIWGRARLILRSKRPLVSGREFAHPQVTPLSIAGRGSLVRYDLAIRNGSGVALEVAGSSGLQPIAASRAHPVDPFAPSRSTDRAYHVAGEPWNLLLKVGLAGEVTSSAPEGREARVASARLACLLQVDGTTWGRARCDLEPRPGPFLAIRLPEAATVPWASVDGAIGPAIGDGPGRWLIPLGDRQPRRVTFAWHLPPTSEPPGQGGSLALPWFDPPAAATLISVEAPEGVDLAISGGGIERIDRAAWEVANVERLARSLVDSFGDLDRDSRRDREAVLDDLTEVELRARHASRIPAGKDGPSASIAGRLEAALASIDEEGLAAGLDDLIREARAGVGADRSVDDPAGGSAPRLPEVVRLRRSGASHFFRATGGDANRPLAISWGRKAPGRRAGSGESWGIAGSGTLLWLAVGALIARGVRPSGRLGIGLASLTVLALLAWEPVLILSALGLFGWGRASS